MRNRKLLLTFVLALMLFLVVVQITAAQPTDGPVIGPDRHLYQFFDERNTWQDARDFCFAQGGHLVTLNSAEENDFVLQLGPYMWLGATDEVCEGDWQWVTGEPWLYSNWAPGEPNNCCPPSNCGGEGCTPEHYLTYDLLPGKWNDVPNGRGPFVCEWDVKIDIKPGSYPNSINLGARGWLPVAVLTTDALDALTVDPATVIFAGASPLRWSVEDVDYDGDYDLLFHFAVQELGLAPVSTYATLSGQSFAGDPFMAADTVRIVPTG